MVDWHPNVPIPGQTSKATPALAEFGGLLHMLHLGNSSNDIWHSSFDGSGWTHNQKIPGQTSKATPALAEFGGLLHMLHLGNSSNDIWHSSFDGSGWTHNQKIPGQTSKATPALAEFGGLLHMLHLGNSSNDIWHSSFDGSGWTHNQKIPGQTSKATPALAEFGGLLHMLHLGNSSNNIWHSSFDGSGWTHNQKIPGQTSKATPALAEFGGLLHMLHLGNSSNNIWHSALDDGTWTARGLASSNPQGVNTAIPDQTSKATPALAEFGGLLHMLHLGNSSNNIWHSLFDPQYIRARYELIVFQPTVDQRDGRQVVRARGSVSATGTEPQPARVRLRLYRDITWWFDTQLEEVSQSGTDVDLTVEYTCPGEAQASGGDRVIYAKIIRGDSSKESRRTTVEDCPPLRRPDHPDRPSAKTVSEAGFFNCESERHVVHYWRRDLTSGSPWESMGTQSHQYNQSGSCPAVGATPFLVELPVDGHIYQIVAVDPRLIGCGGNDPNVGACQKLSVTLEAGPTGRAVLTIG